MESHSKTFYVPRYKHIVDEAYLKKFDSNRHQAYTNHKVDVDHNVHFYCKMKPLASSPRK